MKKITILHTIIVLLLTTLSSCNKEINMQETEETKKAGSTLAIAPRTLTRVIDDDNLQSEQTIKDLNLFLTETSSNIITTKYVNQYFTAADSGCLSVNLPETAEQLQQKDIYVVANYANTNVLDTITTVSGLLSLPTPVASASAILNPEEGICMYGKALNYDFTATGNSPIYVQRTCAKLRVTAIFPDSDYTSSNNSFLINHTAGYTQMAYSNDSIPASGFYDFYSQIQMALMPNNNYQEIAYIYESNEAPTLQLYVRFDNASLAKVFSVLLPVPERNYLYDIEAEFHQEASSQGAKTREGIIIPESDWHCEWKIRELKNW